MPSSLACTWIIVAKVQSNAAALKPRFDCSTRLNRQDELEASSCRRTPPRLRRTTTGFLQRMMVGNQAGFHNSTLTNLQVGKVDPVPAAAGACDPRSRRPSYLLRVPRPRQLECPPQRITALRRIRFPNASVSLQRKLPAGARHASF